ncbi:MAG: phosphoribosylformylglycinamidine synthase, partial [Spirochaetaceae bacterium]
MDEAYRAHIALGGDPDRAYALDNFCWPDPVLSPDTPDGEYKLAQLVRACRGLHDACVAYNLPLISGKDSMKNDARLAGRKVSVRPTLLISLMGVIEDAATARSTDFVAAGHAIYLLGETRGELGGTAFEKLLQRGDPAAVDHLGPAPRVEPQSALALYRALHAAIGNGLVATCHDLADGGLAVALAESALGGRLGARIDIAPLL